MSRTYSADAVPEAWYTAGTHVRVLANDGAVLMAGRLNASYGTRGVMPLLLETDDAVLPVEFEVPEGAVVEAVRDA